VETLVMVGGQDSIVTCIGDDVRSPLNDTGTETA
jgi:hypothetical protein